MKEVIFNAENAAAGRIASSAAKELLKGRAVHIVNAEKAIITGDRRYIIDHFKQKVERGDPYKGPFYPRAPERILKRMVRGMVPYKKPLGKQAFKHLRVYLSVPEELQGKEYRTIPRKKEGKSMTLQELSKELKG